MDENGKAVNPYVLPASILIAAVLISGSVLYAFRNGGSSSAASKLVGAFINGAQPLATFQTAIDAVVAKPVKKWPSEVADADSGKAVKNVPAVSDGDNVLGDAKAPVTIIEYADYQCPFCAGFFTNVEPTIVSAYVNTGKAKFIFRNFPFLGPESLAAANAAECARDQGKFWQYHDAIYAAERADAAKNPTKGGENNGNLNRALFMKIAGDLQMDANAFGQCFDAKKYGQKVTADYNGGQSGGVNGTPATYVE
jgi:protein-disulfide isomerase